MHRFGRREGDVVVDEGASLLCSTTISDFNEARQFCRLDKFFVEAGGEFNISSIVVSSNELVGEIGGNGEVGGDPAAEGLDLKNVKLVKNIPTTS